MINCLTLKNSHGFFLVRKFHIVPKEQDENLENRKSCCLLFFFENLHDALYVRVGKKKGGIYNAEDRARGVGGMIKSTILSRL